MALLLYPLYPIIIIIIIIILVINYLMHKICFIISLLCASTCFEHYVLIIGGGQNCIIQHLVSSHL